MNKEEQEDFLKSLKHVSWDLDEVPEPLKFVSRNGWSMWVKWRGYANDKDEALKKDEAQQLLEAYDKENNLDSPDSFRPRKIFEASGWKCMDCLS